MDYSKLKRPTQAEKKPIILFYNGTFAPIHDGHIAAITSAKNHLESIGYEVLGAYLSPAHGCYSEAKLKENYIVSRHRMEMCFLATDPIDWLNVDTWEMMQQAFTSFVQAMPEFYLRLKKYVPFLAKLDFTVGWVVGVDSYHPVMFRGIPSYLDICVKNRSGFDDKIEVFFNEPAVKEAIDTTVFVDAEILDISSTEIRKAVLSGGSIDKFYKNMPKVAEYIIKNDLWKPPNPLQFRIIQSTPLEPNIIDLALQITPKNMTTALQLSGWLEKNESIVKFTRKAIGEEFGCSGALYLLDDIEYEPENTNKLKNFVFKFGGKAAGFGKFGLEEKFYTRLSVDDKLFPKCFATFKSAERQGLAMEFLDGYSCFDMRDGIPTPLLLEAVRELARMQAMYQGQSLEEVQSIGSPDLRDWMLKRLLGYGMKFTKDAVEHGYGLECYNAMDHPKLEDEVTAYITRLDQSRFQTLLHFDSWIHNWMFHKDLIQHDKKYEVMSMEEMMHEIGHPRNDRGGVALIDWEYTSKGNGVVDFGFLFWTAAIDASEIEVSTALFYYTQLCHYGVKNYTYNSFLKDYRDAKLYTFHRLISTFGHCMGPAYNAVEHWKNIRENMLQLLDDFVPEKFKAGSSATKNKTVNGKKRQKTNFEEDKKKDCNLM